MLSRQSCRQLTPIGTGRAERGTILVHGVEPVVLQRLIGDMISGLLQTFAVVSYCTLAVWIITLFFCQHHVRVD